MTPSLQGTREVRRLIVLGTLGFWVLIFAVFCLPILRYGRTPAWQVVGVAAAIVTGAALCPLVWAALKRTAAWAVARRVAVMGLVCALLAVVQAGFDHLIWEAAAYLWSAGAPRPDYVDGALLNLGLYLWIYGLYATGAGLLLTARKAQERERQLTEARAAADRAQLAALRFQVNPHFLFNALNAAAALVAAGRNRQAEAVLMRLSDFFRSSLTTAPTDEASLEEEFDLVAAYLDIEAERFGERLVVELDLPEGLRHANCPPVLLQPLVENAVKHGVAPAKRPVTVQIRAVEREGRLWLQVRDDGGELGVPPPPGAGVGLDNVRARLNTLYGPDARLVARPLSPGFSVEIETPLAFLPAERAAA